MATDTTLRPGELKNILLHEIQSADLAADDVSEVGTVLEVRDGVARIYGLNSAVSSEMLEFTAQETGGGMSACWELYNPSGLSLGGQCGQGERTLAVAGGHTIRIFDNGDNNTGTYDMNLVVVSDSPST